MPTHVPKVVIEPAPGGSAQRPFGQALGAPPSSRLTAYERHVVGHYRVGEALEGEHANLFDRTLQRPLARTPWIHSWTPAFEGVAGGAQGYVSGCGYCCMRTP
jgi:hypothetical protein